MANGDLMNKLDLVLKYFRRSNDPFGGIQLVCAADWLQLPPVFKNGEKQEFAFQSRSWREATFSVVILKQIVRQQENSVLLRVLNELRVGNTDSLHLLEPRIGATWEDSEIEPVRIFCKNIDVDGYNRERLDQLKTQAKVYEAHDSSGEYATDYFNKNCPAPQTLELRLGAQVMLLTNIDTNKGLVNGSIGVVKAFGPQGVTVKFAAGGTAVIERVNWEQKEQEVAADGKIRYKVVAQRNQIPLKVAYASTVHKCQGMTLDRAIIDVADAFSSGQAYVALSRVRDMESLSLAGAIPASAIQVNPACVRFYQEAEQI
jgi:ATP-dependent exoDNAse (exonuclease V) alpha subunit